MFLTALESIWFWKSEDCGWYWYVESQYVSLDFERLEGLWTFKTGWSCWQVLICRALSLSRSLCLSLTLSFARFSLLFLPRSLSLAFALFLSLFFLLSFFLVVAVLTSRVPSRAPPHRLRCLAANNTEKATASYRSELELRQKLADPYAELTVHASLVGNAGWELVLKAACSSVCAPELWCAAFPCRNCTPML